MPTAHPDEGTIHAWLDGALDDAESSRIAAHVAGCADCAAATAEARGLIAGAARVVRALDQNDARAGLVPSTEGSLWRTLRVTPARAAIAATLLVVAGLTLTRDWAAHERFTPATAVRRAPASVAEAAARDPLLDSAIRRNVAQAAPPRAVQRAPGVDLPQPEAPASAMSTDRSAPARVAEGRAAARVVAESAPVAADAASAAAVSSSSASASAVASRAAPMAMKAVGGTSMRPSRECLLVGFVLLHPAARELPEQRQ